MSLVTKYEKLNPSLEPSHAFAEAIKIAPKLSKETIMYCKLMWRCQRRIGIFSRARLGKRLMKEFFN